MSLILWEIWTYAQIPLFIWGFRRFAGRDVRGDIIAGAILGAFIEFSTEPLWDYHLRITLYKDVPLSIIPSWGIMYTFVVFYSEKLYFKLFKKTSIVPGDKRIFLCDVLCGVPIGVGMEWVGLKAGIWTYRYERLGWDWGMVPGLGLMPWEAVFGYGLLMLTAPTFVRCWQGAFEGRRTG